jgi:hypothetical protein
MRGFAVRLFLLLPVLLSLIAQDRPDAQFGNFLYKMPNGWKPTEKGDTTIIYAPSMAPGTLTYFAIAANDLEGSLQNSFNVLWRGFQTSYRVLQGGQISPLHSPQGWHAFYTSAVAADQAGRRWTAYVLGAQYKSRIQVVEFMSSLPAGSDLNACFNVFQKFLASLSFGDALPGAAIPPAGPAPAPEGPHALPAGALEGIYAGFEIGLGGGLKRLNFNPDGWVVKDIPQEGMIGFNFTAYRNDRNTNRSWVGRYRVDGDRIHIVWEDYPNHRDVIRRNENSASPGIDVYVPMCRCTGKHFSGRYNYGLNGSGQYLEFFPDGSFVDHGVLDQMLVPNPYFEHPRTQRGSYAIQSQTIVFTFADGHRGMRTFYAPKAQERGQLFDFIGLGWHTLYEQHYRSQP